MRWLAMGQEAAGGEARRMGGITGRRETAPSRPLGRRAAPCRDGARMHVASAVLLVALAGATGCTFRPGEAVLSAEGLSAVADPPVADLAAPDPVDTAARDALLAGETRWRETGSGAEGTVRALGAVDPQGCIAARLTVHDYSGLRVEQRALCPAEANGENVGGKAGDKAVRDAATRNAPADAPVDAGLSPA